MSIGGSKKKLSADELRKRKTEVSELAIKNLLILNFFFRF